MGRPEMIDSSQTPLRALTYTRGSPYTVRTCCAHTHVRGHDMTHQHARVPGIEHISSQATKETREKTRRQTKKQQKNSPQ